MTKQTLGKQLRDMREKLGLSIEEAHTQAGISMSSWKSIENGYNATRSWAILKATEWLENKNKEVTK